MSEFGQCECFDSGCSAHKGKKSCGNNAEMYLYRLDMEDETGTAFCEDCASDAMDARVFTDVPSSEQDEDEDEY